MNNYSFIEKRHNIWRAYGSDVLKTLLENIQISPSDGIVLDDVLALKEMNKALAGELGSSVSRFFKEVTEMKTMRFNDSELQGLLFLNKMYYSPYTKLKSHDFIIMSSLSRAIALNQNNKKTLKYSEVFTSYDLEREIDIVLGNNGATSYHSYLQLVSVLVKSILVNEQI